MQSFLTSLLVFWTSVCVVQSQDEKLSIAAFNVQIFGVSKFSETEVVAILSRVSTAHTQNTVHSCWPVLMSVRSIFCLIPGAHT